MLSKVLSKSDCAACKFCCSFRRQSLWETPIFDQKSVEKLQKLYPNAKFRPVTTSIPGNFFTVDLMHLYKTDNPEEEAPCPFLQDGTGCVLPPELKPFDCSIWPIRVIQKDDSLKLVLTPTCQAINKIPFEQIKAFVNSELKEKILNHTKNHPEIIKTSCDSSFFKELF